MNYLFDRNTGEKIAGVYEKDGELWRRDYVFYDTVMNVSDSGVEVLKFPQPFRVPKVVALDPEMCSTLLSDVAFAEALSAHRWKSVDGMAVAVDPTVTIADLIRSRSKAASQSKSKFYNYALGNNNWQYFCTWTFASEKARNDKELLYDSYNKFIKSLRRTNPGMKALATYEEFEKGGYHMHALLGDCRLHLIPAVDPKNGQFLYSHASGAQIFNCLDWTEGFSTVCCIHPNSVKEQVVNYCGKYMSKKCPAPYGCKRFFHTINLDCRDCYMFSSKDNNEPIVKMLYNYKGNVVCDDLQVDTFASMVNAFDLDIVKSTDSGLKVYKSHVDLRDYMKIGFEGFQPKIG